MLLAFTLLAVAPRQTVNLDSGWMVGRVPSAPSLWKGQDMVPTSSWRVLSVSSEETSAENAKASNVFDGDPKTIWHTEWSKRQTPYPHSLSIDLGGPTEAVGIRFLPRQTPPQNGRPNHIRVFLDSAKVLDGVVPDSSSLYEARFSRTTGRVLRLEFLDGHKPEPYLALSEIGLIRPTRLGSDWKSQYNIALVKAGDARYDLSIADLDRLRPLELGQIHDWKPATLPQPAWIRPLNDSKIWQGVSYYRCHVSAPPSGKRTILSLQGMQSVDVWLNGKHIAERRGGYMPLRTPLHEGGELLVRVDNSDNPLIPPGKPQSQLDFMYGNGLISDATLETTNTLHLPEPNDPNGGIWVGSTKRRNGKAWTLIHLRVVNDGASSRSFVLHQVILGPSGKHISGPGMRGTVDRNRSVEVALPFEIESPQWWSPDSPSLYKLQTSIEENGHVVDRIESHFGLRTIEVSRKKGFVLNGKPIHLVGTNRHQDYPWVGPALSDAAQRRDVLLIKRAGHNIVRLSHYDQSPAFLDACDELGVMVIPCIPGWQFINRDVRFSDRVSRDIRETIRRDRRHPAVAFWETSLNETYPPGELAQAWHKVAKQEGAELTAGDEGKNVPWEITYNGWRDDFTRPSNSDKPGYIREYGDYEFGGATSTSRVRIGDGLEKLLDETWNHVWSLNRYRPQYPWTMGEGTWEMFDHNVPWDFAVSASGMADLMRREKPSFWFFASQHSPKPYLKIAADWQPGADRRTVIVFTNADSASLYVNGHSIGSARPEHGKATDYDLQKAFDGTNTANLLHPPIVFRDVPYSPGELKVVGSNGASMSVHTAGKPAGLKVWIDDLGVAPSTNDMVFVRAAVVDANGVVCPNESRLVRFSGATFAGESQAHCEMGVASVLVRTPLKPGAIQFRAEATDLSGSCRFIFR